MRFAVVTLGSAGDLHPFLAVARELTRRGHEVQMLSQAPYESQVAAEGVPFRAVAGAAAHERTLHHPLLWHPLHGFGVLWRHLAVPAIEPTCEALGDLVTTTAGKRLTVLASPLAAGARFARERWPDRIRLLSGYTAPMGLRSIEDPMFLGAWRVPRWLPPSGRQALWYLLDRWKLEPMAGPTLERWQQAWRTPRIKRSVFGDWLHSPDGGVALYPREFAPVPQPWRQRGVVQTGFPLFEPDAAPALPRALLDFIQQHQRYVLVYPGSAAAAVSRFDELVVPACQQLGMATIVLAPHLRGALESRPADRQNVFEIDQAPLSRLLAAASAFVHHGGIGSAAQALRQGVPQLVLASAYDQFENGERITMLGAGAWTPIGRASLSDVTAKLSALLLSARRTETNLRSPAAAPRLPIESAGRTSLARVCELLESVSATS